MFKRNLTTLAIAAMLASGAFSANAMSPAFSADVAREDAEGPRGADNERPGDRQRRGGRLTTETLDIVAKREASEGPRGEGVGHPLSDVKDVIAREASEGPRGADNERPGDRQRRGGRMS